MFISLSSKLCGFETKIKNNIKDRLTAQQRKVDRLTGRQVDEIDRFFPPIFTEKQKEVFTRTKSYTSCIL